MLRPDAERRIGSIDADRGDALKSWAAVACQLLRVGRVARGFGIFIGTNGPELVGDRGDEAEMDNGAEPSGSWCSVDNAGESSLP